MDNAMADWQDMSRGFSFMCKHRFLGIILAVSSIFDEHIFELVENNLWYRQKPNPPRTPLCVLLAC